MEQNPQSPGLSGRQVIGIVVAAMLLTMVATLFIVRSWLFPRPFDPVVLSPAEEQRLEHKLAWFERGEGQSRAGQPTPGRPGQPAGSLQPEAYSEKGASREIRLSEREVNAMIAHNTDLAPKVAVDFSADLVSVKMLLPIDPDAITGQPSESPTSPDGLALPTHPDAPARLHFGGADGNGCHRGYFDGDWGTSVDQLHQKAAGGSRH